MFQRGWMGGAEEPNHPFFFMTTYYGRSAYVGLLCTEADGTMLSKAEYLL
jgi:hypothetical protein